MNLNPTLPGAGLAGHWPPAEALDGLSRNAESLALSNLRSRLLQEALANVADPELSGLVRLAAGEAEAQAWLTSFPLLLFPALFEEKTERLRSYVARQRRLRPERAGWTASQRLHVRALPGGVR